jgi:putative transposase
VASVFVSLVFALRSAARSRAALHLEILALRHQVAVLNRSRPSKRRLTAADRVLWKWLSQVGSGWRPALVLVKPDTVLAWHRRGFRPFWTWKSRHRTGRPAAAPALGCAADSWGTAEAGDLGESGDVAKYMPRRDKPPSQPWRTFLANHVGQIMAADFFVVPTVTDRLLFVLVILAHDRRRIVHVAVTDHPTAAWTAQQFRNAFPRTRRRGTCCTTAIPRSRTHVHHRRDADPRGPHRSAIAAAECLRRARHWLDPT